MTPAQEKIEKLLQQQKPFTAEEAHTAGISAQMLAHYCRKGKLERACRGIYTPPETEITQYPEIELLVRKKTDFVVCLISALQIHEFTTQLANTLWLAIRQGARIPSVQFPIHCIRLTDAVYSYGIEERELNGLKFKVFSAAKTVADCFKFRNKIGLDVALEALKEGYRKKMFTPSELHNAAEICRVKNVIRPYEELILS